MNGLGKGQTNAHPSERRAKIIHMLKASPQSRLWNFFLFYQRSLSEALILWNHQLSPGRKYEFLHFPLLPRDGSQCSRPFTLHFAAVVPQTFISFHYMNCLDSPVGLVRAVLSPQWDPRECTLSFLLRATGLARNLGQLQRLASEPWVRLGYLACSRTWEPRLWGQVAGVGISVPPLPGVLLS